MQMVFFQPCRNRLKVGSNHRFAAARQDKAENAQLFQPCGVPHEFIPRHGVSALVQLPAVINAIGAVIVAVVIQEHVSRNRSMVPGDALWMKHELAAVDVALHHSCCTSFRQRWFRIFGTQHVQLILW